MGRCTFQSPPKVPMLNYDELYYALRDLLWTIADVDLNENEILADEALGCLCTLMAFMDERRRDDLPNIVAELLSFTEFKNFSVL
ncbi:unnamed protein product [Clavelina lepadiformis]|uniref:Uncharacterized protein n=1 Tax=Clavelina lepadiformis TaxID=159417 RepID=A0ABP0G329_CLALP